MRERLVGIGLLLLITINSQAQMLNPITPAPVTYESLKATGVSIQSSTILYYPASFAVQANYMQQQIEQQTGIRLQLSAGSPSKTLPRIILQTDEKSITRPEMYHISAAGKQVIITANDIRGFVNATQTLLQLLPNKKSATATIPAVAITDYPQFSYRGMHLDVVRHIFPVSYVKKYIDYLAFHKFNTFHWHLTDDQGWRFEVKSYPKLNSVGSWRDSTLIGHFKDVPARYERKRYGGFYTRNEIREVIAYAAVRGITIIPELDIPGHSRATIAAYPEFSTKPDTTWNVASTWGMYNRQNNVLAPNEASFQFLKDIFTELAELFPSTYIHIGGDECSMLWWKQDPNTQAFMKSKNLPSEKALETYFIEYVAKHLKQLHKKSVGWHEIAEGDLDTTTLIMNWSDDKQALAVAKKGFEIIQTPGKPFYFDHYQSKDPNDSLAIHGYNPVEAVYQYQVVPNAVKAAGLAHKIIGAQANVWTEYMAFPTKVDYMVFPRMTALSENLWSQQKDYPDFLRRLEAEMIPRYKSWNSSYFQGYKVWTRDK